MPARKQQDVPPDVANPVHDAIGAGTDLIRRFSSRTTVAKQLPARTLLLDVIGTTPLVLAIIPFYQIAVGLRFTSEPGQLAGSDRALQRTGEHFCESEPLQSPAQTLRIHFAPSSERQISEASMLT